ncbi:MAG TPA: MarR family transcriptional regulator [Solirubrobacteraceae bacterium]|nr:MarR family transcriptional regulator [Solirubrobacteraceae bacterium]
MSTDSMTREEQAMHVASQLVPRAALLTRLLARHLRGALTRPEISLLNTLQGGPRRITELADLEGVAQPTMTQLVKRLEAQGLVERARQTDDGRVVVVSLTEAGAVAFDGYRTQAAIALSRYLDHMSDEEIEALATATETLAELARLLQRGGAA